jgi:nucleoid-associated protein YgaU
MGGNRWTLAIIALLVLAGVAFFVFRDDLGKRALPPQAAAPQLPIPTLPPGPAPAPPGQAAAVAPPAAPVRPTFDVVRVSRNCTAVIAGRATPGALVVVGAGQQEIGRVTADPRGEWALVPDLPLKSGSREISLKSRLPGGQELEAAAVVVVSVPVCDPNNPTGDQAIAVLTPRQGASQLLQIPEARGSANASGLSLNTVDYDDAGNLVMSGRAKAGTTVQVYVNNQPVGAPTAAENGRWTLKLDKSVPPGLYTLRVDQVEDTGKVVSRLEVPFARASQAEVGLASGSVVVQPGNSLWRIARSTYGSGTSFTTIYQANKDQIRDPDMIYPGQVFALPNQPGAIN